MQGFPKAQRGMVIGLLGGSFDPAHSGHVHVTHEALARIGLDRVWWLVSPGNLLKSRQPAPMAERIARARAILGDDPRVVVTDLEARLGTRATNDTLRKLQAIYPGVRFVWLMGADNLVQFHRWSHWREIFDRVPVAVMARPGAGLSARLSVAARAYRTHQVTQPELLLHRAPPVWCFVNMPLNPASSTQIRAQGSWHREWPADWKGDWLRRAEPKDAPALLALTRAAYAKWVPLIGREPLPMRADMAEAIRLHRVDLREEGGQFLALVETRIAADHLWVENLCVEPKAQGRGLGHRLLGWVEALTLQAGLHEIRLLTNAAFTGNIAFYRAHGFDVVREEPFLGGTTIYLAKTLTVA